MSLMTPKEKGNLWIGLSSVFYLLAANSYFSPPSPPATGRWAWLHNTFSSLFGSGSDAILFAVLGSIGIVIAVSNFRAAQKSKTGA
ncbi:MAG TPA: hypothetical protein VFW68_04925 [Rhodocyclaceae bacterium]|nr:hypothetical protein [Rhodocyclaceae bacterium]